MKKTVFLLLIILGMLVPMGQAATYRSYYTMSQDWKALDDQNSDMRRYYLGSSVEGRPIYVYDIGNRRATNIIYLVASMHGGEHVTTETLYYTVKWLLSNDPVARGILANNRIYVNPMANPDRYVTDRENANDVNLNRNFKYNFDPDFYDAHMDGTAGSYYYSEPETRQIVRVLKWGVDWYIDLHAGMHKIIPMGRSSTYRDMTWRYGNYCYRDGLTPSPVSVSSSSRIATSHADAYFTYGKKAMLYEISTDYLPNSYTIQNILSPRLNNLIRSMAD